MVTVGRKGLARPLLGVGVGRAPRGPLRGFRQSADVRRRHPALAAHQRRLPAGTYARVDVIYSRFVTTLTQKPEMLSLLPIKPSEDTEGIPDNQFIFEPSAAAVLEQPAALRLGDDPVPDRAGGQGLRGIQPHGPATKNATENAGDLIDDLTLSYNKVRQSNITREMIEIRVRRSGTLTLKNAPGRGNPHHDDRRSGRDRPSHPVPPAPSSTSCSPPVSCRRSSTRSSNLREGQEHARGGEGPAAPRRATGCVPSPSPPRASAEARTSWTRAAIRCPVGEATVGRVFNVLGEPIDRGEPFSPAPAGPSTARPRPCAPRPPRPASSRPA